MNRRNFLKQVTAAAAVGAVAPKDWVWLWTTVDGKTIPAKEFFDKPADYRPATW